MRKQQVHEGVTQSGVRGLFTGNYLVLSLKDGEDAKAKALQCGFEFDETINTSQHREVGIHSWIYRLDGCE